MTKSADGGGRHTPRVLIVLESGENKVLVRYSSAITRAQEITVAASPVRSKIDEGAPKVE